jgi:predicted phage terminase large subunit-like protein
MKRVTPRERDAILRENFAAFLEKVFEALHPNEEFVPNWHLEAIAWQLQQCLEGKIRRLVILLPPRHLKSLIASVALPAFILGHNPSAKIICASYGQKLASELHQQTHHVMKRRFYRRLFPRTNLSRASAGEGEFKTTQHGYRFATSVEGSMTGRGADFIIVDDPIKPDDAGSETRREAVKNWFFQTVMTRLNNQETGVMIVVMQRLHEDDLAGELIRRGWTVLSIPAIAQDDESYAIGASELYRRKANEVLHDARTSREVLEIVRTEMGSRAFSAQFLQSPMPADNGFVRWEWFLSYDEPPQFDFVVQSWDPATIDDANANFSVCTTWGITVRNGEKRFYLLDVVREKLGFPQLLRRVHLENEKWKPDLILVEAIGSGSALFQQLRAQGLQHLHPMRPSKPKPMRFEAVTPMIERGQVLVPGAAEWLEAFRNELLAFPNRRYDDQVDSVSQLLRFPDAVLSLAQKHRRSERANRAALPRRRQGSTMGRLNAADVRRPQTNADLINSFARRNGLFR